MLIYVGGVDILSIGLCGSVEAHHLFFFGFVFVSLIMEQEKEHHT